MTKYIFVTGGVMSGIGKGIVVASIGALLKESKLKITIKKMDPYLNIDSGTMNPFEHGETFVTKDGLEADLDLGHYERFAEINTNKNSIITSGKIYQNIFEKERNGAFLGKTVQMIPHVANEMISFIENDSDKYDVILVEIGGTVGDIEGMIHIEAIRQMIGKHGRKNVLNIHLTYIPYLKVSDEFKTKPAQDSIKKLMQLGIQPDIIVCRYETEDVNVTFKEKISLFSNLKKKNIILAPNINNIYKIPYLYFKEKINNRVLKLLKIKKTLDNTKWEKIYNTISNLDGKININIVVKYAYADAYISLIEALKHASYIFNKDIKLNWIDARSLTKDEIINKLKDKKGGILVPGGFGESGVENKIEAIKFARENNIPFLGICYGMQLMTIEYARNILGIENATTAEIDPDNKYPHIVHIINDKETKLGGTMRLGDFSGEIKKDSIAAKAYKSNTFTERHRHRYEINTEYRNKLEKKGLIFTGTSSKEKYMEIAEIPSNTFCVGVQYHPELNSTVFTPNPIILAFIKSIINL